jgi:hypothetical protein
LAIVSAERGWSRIAAGIETILPSSHSNEWRRTLFILLLKSVAATVVPLGTVLASQLCDDHAIGMIAVDEGRLILPLK